MGSCYHELRVVINDRRNYSFRKNLMFKNLMIGTFSAVVIVAAGITACTAQAAAVAENEPVETN